SFVLSDAAQNTAAPHGTRTVKSCNAARASSNSTILPFCIVACHLPDGCGHGANVLLAHALVDGHANSGLEDGLGLRARDLRVVHRGKTHFLEGPATSEETVFLKDRIAVQGHGDVTRRCRG